MRVVVTHTDLRLYWIARLTALEEALRRRGDELRVLELSGAGSPYGFAGPVGKRPSWWRVLFPDIPMEALPPKEAKVALMRALDEEAPDVVISGAIAYPSGAGALAWSLRRRRPWIVMDNARRQDVPRGWLNTYMKRRLYGACAAAVLPSETFSESYQFWGIPRDRHFYGLNVVDNDFFARHAAAARRDPVQERAKLGLPRAYVLGVGRQVPKKNWSLLIEAMGEVGARVGPEAPSLVLVGDGPERTRLKNLAGDIPSVKVVFLPFLRPDLLAVAYALAQVVVLPSTAGETWGLTVNEAMASGTPVIVSDACGCASTLVVDGASGWVFPAGNATALASALEGAAKEDPLAREVRAGATRDSISRWGLAQFCEGVLGAIRRARGAYVDRTPSATRWIAARWSGRYRPT